MLPPMRADISAAANDSSQLASRYLRTKALMLAVSSDDVDAHLRQPGRDDAVDPLGQQRQLVAQQRQLLRQDRHDQQQQRERATISAPISTSATASSRGTRRARQLLDQRMQRIGEHRADRERREHRRRAARRQRPRRGRARPSCRIRRCAGVTGHRAGRARSSAVNASATRRRGRARRRRSRMARRDRRRRARAPGSRRGRPSAGKRAPSSACTRPRSRRSSQASGSRITSRSARRAAAASRPGCCGTLPSGCAACGRSPRAAARGLQEAGRAAPRTVAAAGPAAAIRHEQRVERVARHRLAGERVDHDLALRHAAA